MKKFIIPIILTAIVISGGIYYWQTTEQTNTPELDPAEYYTNEDLGVSFKYARPERKNMIKSIDNKIYAEGQSTYDYEYLEVFKLEENQTPEEFIKKLIVSEAGPNSFDINTNQEFCAIKATDQQNNAFVINLADQSYIQPELDKINKIRQENAENEDIFAIWDEVGDENVKIVDKYYKHCSKYSNPWHLPDGRRVGAGKTSSSFIYNGKDKLLFLARTSGQEISFYEPGTLEF